MDYHFFIQAGQPRFTHNYAPDAETLGEAIEAVFPLLTEDMILTWNHIYIPIGYKYGIGMMCDDILYMLSNLLKLNKGYLSISWPSNTFASTWNLHWQESQLKIDTIWNNVAGGTEKLLNEESTISLAKDMFASEWKKPLEIIAQGLRECGYSEDQLPQIAMLQEVVNSIKYSGILYR